jgi:hypothetical protein
MGLGKDARSRRLIYVRIEEFVEAKGTCFGGVVIEAIQAVKLWILHDDI